MDECVQAVMNTWIYVCAHKTLACKHRSVQHLVCVPVWINLGSCLGPSQTTAVLHLGFREALRWTVRISLRFAPVASEDSFLAVSALLCGMIVISQKVS
jgi:hypothetical protein